MSLVRLPTLECDACTRLVPRTYIGDRWMSAQDLRHSAGRANWVRRGRQDICPHCAGYYEDRRCIGCGRMFSGGYKTICPTCTGEALPDQPRTLEDAHRDEMRAAGMLP